MSKKSVETSSAVSDLGKALVEAIELTRPLQKKSILNRKKGGPWAPKDGSPKIKLRRTHYQHSVRMEAETLNNEDIALLNKIRPGVYCDGHVKVILRKDRGIDIDYPIRTAAQRLRLGQFGITSLTSLLTRCIDEASKPAKVDDGYPEDSQ